MTWESRSIRVGFMRRPSGRPQFSTGPVDGFRVGPPAYAADMFVSHIFPSPYGHGFEKQGSTSKSWEVNR